MDITQLRYFLTTAQTLNYTKAAKQLYISRQALRQALSVLEREFDTPLFENRRNKLSLTAAGEYLRMTGSQVVENFDKACEGMKHFSGQKSVLTIALCKSLFPFMLPELDQLLKIFQSRCPAICLEFLTMSNDEAIEAVALGHVSLSLVIQMPWKRPGLAMETLVRYDAIMSCEDPDWPKPGSLCPKDLEGRFCIGMGSLYETMRPFYEACKKEGIRLTYEVVPDTIDAFYQVNHNHAMAFDILKEDAPFYDRGSFSPLEGYSWEIGFLRQENSPQQELERMFCILLQEEYLRMKTEKQY